MINTKIPKTSVKRLSFMGDWNRSKLTRQKSRMFFSFLDKDTYDRLLLTRWLDKSGHPIPGHPELPAESAVEIKVLAKGSPVSLDLLVRSNLVQQDFTRLVINSIALLNKSVSVARDVCKSSAICLTDVERQDHEWVETMQRLIITET